MGLNKTGSGQSPVKVSIYKPSGISSIFNWFGQKNKNELSSSVIGKNCFKFKLNSLDLDSLKINSEDMKVLKNTLKIKQNGPGANIFRIPKSQLGMREDEFFTKVIAPNLVKSKKDKSNKEKCLWSTSSLSVTSKQKTHKTVNVKTVGKIKSHKSLVKGSSSSSKTTLKVHYKRSSKINIPKPTYNSILKKSIPPNILKSNIENPVFVPIWCIGKRNSELANEPPNCTEQRLINDLETKTKVIPVLMKKMKSMEDQISTISSTTKQIKEVVSHQNELSKLNLKNEKQLDTPLTLDCSRSQKILPNPKTKNSKRVKAKRIKTRGQSFASNAPFISASESCKNLGFVFEPKANVLSAFNKTDETPNPFRCQTLPKEDQHGKEANEPIKTLFDAYPNVGWDTIAKMYKDLSEDSDSATPGREIENSHRQIESNDGSESNPYVNLFKDVHQFLQQFQNLPSLNGCEAFGLTGETGYSAKSLIDLSVPSENISLPASPSVFSMNKAELNENVLLGESDVSKCTEVPNGNLLTRNDSYPKCGCSMTTTICEQLNYKTDESDNNVNGIVMKKSTHEIGIEPLEILTHPQQCLANYKSCEDLTDTGTEISPSSHIDDNADVKESAKCHDIQSENILDWIQNACSIKDNKPEVSIMIQVKDDHKCLVLESLSPKLLNTEINEKPNDDGIHKEAVGNRCVSGETDPKVQSYNTRSILTASEGVQCDNDPSKSGVIPLRKRKEYLKTISTNNIQFRTGEFETKNRPFSSMENMKHVKSIEFESAGRGDVRLPTTKAYWSPVEKEIRNIGKEDAYLVFNGRCDYLDRNKRAIFDERIRSKTSISDTENPSPRVSLAHFTVKNVIEDSMLESVDTKHYNLDSDNLNSQYPYLMQLGDTNVIKNMSSEMLKSRDVPPILGSHCETKCFRYDSVLGTSPREKASVERLLPKLIQPSKFFRCIETETDLEVDQEIKFNTKRWPRQCGLMSLQDIEEIVDESEEEIEDTGENYELEMRVSIEIPADESVRGDKKYIAENPTVVPDVRTRNSSVSVQTDWSLIGITVDHFRSSTCLANTDKPSVGSQTEEIIDDNKKLVLSSSLLTDSIQSSKFFVNPSGTSLRHPCLHVESNSSGENSEIKVSELFLNVIQHNSDLENNVMDSDTTKTLDNFGKVEAIREIVSVASANESSLKEGFKDKISYQYGTNSTSASYNSSDTEHACSHPCFPSFSDETINSNVNIFGSDAFIQQRTYGFVPNISLVNSDIINIHNENESDPTRPYVFSEDVNVNSLAKTNSFCKESSVSRFPLIVTSLPQNINDVDVFRFKSRKQCSLNSDTNYCEDVKNIGDSIPVASVVRISDSTKTEGNPIEENVTALRKLMVTNNSYVVNYLYEIEYDILENTICYDK